MSISEVYSTYPNTIEGHHAKQDCNISFNVQWTISETSEKNVEFRLKILNLSARHKEKTFGRFLSR